MFAAKPPEEETRAAACRLTALPLRSPAWARGGAGRWWEHGGENEAMGMSTGKFLPREVSFLLYIFSWQIAHLPVATILQQVENV